MEFILNYVFAWLTVFIGIFLSAKFIVRKLASSNMRNKRIILQLNKIMRKSHIWLGILMIVIGLVHGIFSSQEVLSFNLGTVTWLVGIILGINYFIRKIFKKGSTWIIYHRALTVGFLLLIVLHIVDVGGIQIFNIINNNQVVYEVETKDKSEHINALDPDIKDDNVPEVAPNAESKINSAPAPDTETEKDYAVTDNEEVKNDLTAPNIEAESLPVTTPETNSSDGVSNDTLEEYNSNLFGVTLADGTYTGVATGYRAGLTVEVEVLNNNVTRIEIIAHNEQNSRFYGRPFKEIPSEIIDKQSLDIDTISGATYSSIGILNAVNDALSKAVISGELPPMKKLPR